MKKLWILPLVFVGVLSFSVGGRAELIVIGEVVYAEENYNLIFEGPESLGVGLVWLDYTKAKADWDSQTAWASGLGPELTVRLNLLYKTSIDWSTGWILPSLVGEMLPLYNETYGREPPEQEPFVNLKQDDLYWTSTTSAGNLARSFSLDPNESGSFESKENRYYAIAVRPGQVSPVPEPTTMLLLGLGLLGLAGFGRKRLK